MRKMYTDKEINELIESKIKDIKPEPLDVTISGLPAEVQGHEVSVTRINNGVIIQPSIGFLKSNPDAYEVLFKIKIKDFVMNKTTCAHFFDSASNTAYTGVLITDESDETGETLICALSTGSPESISAQLWGSFICLNEDAVVEE